MPQIKKSITISNEEPIEVLCEKYSIELKTANIVPFVNAYGMLLSVEIKGNDIQTDPAPDNR